MTKHSEFHEAAGRCTSCKGTGRMFSFADFKRWQGVVPDEVAIRSASQDCDNCHGTGRHMTDEEYEAYDPGAR